MRSQAKADSRLPRELRLGKPFPRKNRPSAFLFLSNLALTRALQAGIRSLYCAREIGTGERFERRAFGCLAARTSGLGLVLGHGRFSPGIPPILLFIGIAAALGTALAVVPLVIAPSKPDPEKLSAYECGFPAFDDARMKFDVRFYLVSILFIIFDLEVAFLFPWAITLKSTGALRLLVHGRVPGRADRRLHLRMEEGSARMGVIPAKAIRQGARAASKAARQSPTTIPISPPWARS